MANPQLRPEYAYVVKSRNMFLSYKYVDLVRVYLYRSYDLSKIIQRLENQGYLIVCLV